MKIVKVFGKTVGGKIHATNGVKAEEISIPQTKKEVSKLMLKNEQAQKYVSFR
jgi:hypothetical protein